MQIMIDGVGDNPRELADLGTWLRRDPELAGVATVSVISPGQTGQMGTAGTLNILLTHAEALFACATSFAAWRASRRVSSRLTVSTKDGPTYVVEGSADDVVRSIVALGASPERTEPDETGASR